MSLSPSGYMMTTTEEQLFQIIIDLVDPTDCSFRENRNFCYAHHYAMERDKPGKCPVQDAKDILTEYGFDKEYWG